MKLYTRLFAIMCLLAIPAVAQETMWTYYDTWCMGDDGQWDLVSANYIFSTNTLFKNRGKLTHIVIFPDRDIMRGDYAPYLSCTREYVSASGVINDSLNVLYNGYNNPGGGTIASWNARGSVPTLIDSCHKVGVKVLLCVNAVSPDVGWNAVVADSVKTQVFVNACARYCNTHNFDGINMNVEHGDNATVANRERFYRRLKQAMGSKLVTIVPIQTNTDDYSADCRTYIDFALPQFYNFHFNWQPTCGSSGQDAPFLSAPLHAVGTGLLPASSNHHALGDMEDGNWGPTRWYTSGWPKNKIVILVTDNAVLATGVTTMFGCGATYGYFKHDSCTLAMKNYGGTETFNSTFVGSYMAGTATAGNPIGLSAGTQFYLMFMSTRNMDSIVAWGRTNGFSNYGLYDVHMDARPTKIPALRIHNHLSSLLNTSTSSSTLTVNPSSLSFGYALLNSTSVQSYSLWGSMLTPAAGSITITAPSGYQVSTSSSSGFTSSLGINYTNSTLTATIYVRFQPTAEQLYSGDVTNDGGGASTQLVSVSGTGVSSIPPVLTISPSLLTFGTLPLNTISAEQTYTLTGSNLSPASGNISVIAPNGFEISLISGSGFASSLDVAYASGTLSTRTLYVRFRPTIVQSYSDTVKNSGGGAATQNLIVSGTAVSPTIGISRTSRAFGNILVNSTSSELTYSLSGSNLVPSSGNLTVTTPTGFQVSLTSGSGFGSSVNVAYSNATLSARTIRLRFVPTEGRLYSDSVMNSGGGAIPKYVRVTGTGVTGPSLSIDPTSLSFGSLGLGTISAEKTYTLFGVNLTPTSGSISLAAPTGFQISSTTGSGFASSLSIAYTSGTLSTRTIYVRFSPSAEQNYSGSISNAGGGATTQNVSVSGSGVSSSSMSIDPDTLAFGPVIVGVPSDEQTYSLFGVNLVPASGNITITASAGFQISDTSGSRFVSTLTIPYTGGNFPSKTIFVRFFPSILQDYSGIISNSGGGATTQYLAATGSGIVSPSIIMQPLSLPIIFATINTSSKEKLLTVSARYLQPRDGNIVINSPRGFQVSGTSASGFDSLVSFPYSNGLLAETHFYALFSPTAIQNYAGYISAQGGGAPICNIPVNGRCLPVDESIQLGQNYPNPFNPATKIPYSVFKRAWVKLSIYNILGQKIVTLVDEEQDPGFYQLEFDPTHANQGVGLTSGVYFYRLEVQGRIFTKKLLFIK